MIRNDSWHLKAGRTAVFNGMTYRKDFIEKKGMEKKMMKELITRNRSYRRFYQKEAITRQQLEKWVDLARLSASGANLQALKYILSYESEKNEKIFLQLRWAGYLKEWDGPEEGEKPSAYIIVLSDKQIRPTAFGVDQGIACQSILLGAVEDGYGGCILGSVENNQLRQIFRIPEYFEIPLVIALGKPKETVVLEEIDESGDVRYYRDDRQVHHVPKRKLVDIIVDL
jgi:nitroreductase